MNITRCSNIYYIKYIGLMMDTRSMRKACVSAQTQNTQIKETYLTILDKECSTMHSKVLIKNYS